MNGKAGNEQVRVSLWVLIFFFTDTLKVYLCSLNVNCNNIFHFWFDSVPQSYLDVFVYSHTLILFSDTHSNWESNQVLLVNMLSVIF